MITPEWRGIFENLVPRFRITSGDEFYHVGREQGIEYPRRVFREMWREINRETGYRFAIANLPPGRPIPRAWFRSTDVPHFDRYTYVFEATIHDPATGWEEHVRARVSQPYTLTRGEAEAIAREYLEGTPKYQGWDIDKLEWAGAYVKK